ncbi:MAG: methionyl-tRNA formyltransferase [Patescibacteria group bacterium]|nr:MAG: methionyl-tRNA formyltransferase [Patescibacteria group bacterium]
MKTQAKPRIIFFGTPAFGRIILQILLDAKFKISAVVTQPDRPAGRKQKRNPSHVKALAKEHRITAFSPASKSELSALDAKLSTLKPDLFVVASYGLIIPKEILDIPLRGSLNVHPSLLPKYRGPSPIQAAILNGDKETGATIMLLDEEMDHGPLLAQEKIALAADETTPTLTGKLAILGGNLLVKTILEYWNGRITPQPQDHAQATVTKLIRRENGKISWGMSNEQIEQMFRAYTPWPGVWTTVGEMADQLDQELRSPKHKDLKLKLLEAHLENGVISLDRVQVEGRKPIHFTDFVKGYLK